MTTVELANPTSEVPTTRDVLSVIRGAGVIVGSWPGLGSAAKDIDVVVKARGKSEVRQPIFEAVLSKWRGSCRSVAPGHLWVDAVPQPIELFEDKAWSIDEPEKDAGRLTFNQANRLSECISCYGIAMLAVREGGLATKAFAKAKAEREARAAQAVRDKAEKMREVLSGLGPLSEVPDSVLAEAYDQIQDSAI